MENFKAAKQEKRVVAQFTADPNLLGMGVGPKEVHGSLQADLALKFFVRAKKPKKELSKAELLPTKVSDLPTDVVKLAPLRARGSFTQKVRPALGGWRYSQ